MVVRSNLRCDTPRGYVSIIVALAGSAVKYPLGVCYDLGMDATDTTASQPGYADDKQALLRRLRRVEGQVRGVARMVEGDRYCIDILTQISAIQAAIDKVALGVMDEHVRHCVVHAPEGERDDKAAELMAAVGRLVRAR